MPGQPLEPHKHTAPLHMWMKQRGLLYDPWVKEGDVWWEPIHTYDDKIGEVIIYKKMPCSPEEEKKIRGELQVTGGNTRVAYHGLPVYAVANVARNGLLPSDNADRRHQSMEGKHGVYVTPYL